LLLDIEYGSVKVHVQKGYDKENLCI